MTITENLFLTGSNVCSVEKTVKRTDKLLQSLTQDMRVGACTRARDRRWKVKHVKSFMMTKPCFHNYNISSLHHRQSCMMQPPGVGLSGNGAMLGRVMVGGMITRGVGNEQWVVTSHLEVWPLTHRVARPSPASFPGLMSTATFFPASRHAMCTCGCSRTSTCSPPLAPSSRAMASDRKWEVTSS